MMQTCQGMQPWLSLIAVGVLQTLAECVLNECTKLIQICSLFSFQTLFSNFPSSIRSSGACSQLPQMDISSQQMGQGHV